MTPLPPRIRPLPRRRVLAAKVGRGYATPAEQLEYAMLQAGRADGRRKDRR